MHEDGFIGRIEWAVAGRALPGQHISGDRCVVLDAGGGTVLFAVLDGLGHGAAAADAADRAAQVLAENRSEPLDVLMVLCHRAMADTRGAAVSLALFDDTDIIRWLGVGNVDCRVLSASPAGLAVRAAVLLTGGIVGYRLPQNLQPQTVQVRAGDLLLMTTDGIVTESAEGIDLSRSTAEITSEILSRHAKDTDDALVLAARHRGGTTNGAS
ncbi:SpoIIE family protein phosphatase [Nocardia amikacinitolerans]|uniref:Stage II sporulation protein E (SpoIIE) n=1 Tax=Nocardia amikacinitolerans TaxID=756689 RepID=A0A285L3S7_9NOCA|nr:SpoIIE family protein phosphatase [Nocardia amikacinitolerans]MCP2277893.1 Stage II sporulation protein E (SpoIIE) [Nocardia amikacinitolerans]MCP2288223.1 Stage II sporulation protein E (SpoIIE) [Nocardia amikacinitolerans]MCP2297769.1 Stage II sporulation protein E (SpoIIE) [Nocardia amikacinitolerans]MCP2315521.1 Stage II sporulation protein E (SpoIIE) [Nocardia amikacinitolerans]SNY79568.1 Stage II sporulation protein E (SpoIIE) [Nocardia amikacinitolerans]